MEVRIWMTYQPWNNVSNGWFSTRKLIFLANYINLLPQIVPESHIILLSNYKRFMADEIEFSPGWVDESRYNPSCSDL
jgi:hypothetical protein